MPEVCGFHPQGEKMGNKPYVAIGPPDGSGEMVDISDNLMAMTMHSNVPFEELRDASISIDGRPAVQLAGGLVAALPRIRIPCGTPHWSVAEVIVDFNSEVWLETTGYHFNGLCVLKGKVTFQGASRDIEVVGSVVDVTTTHERVPQETEEFGTSEMFRVLGLIQTPKGDESTKMTSDSHS